MDPLIQALVMGVVQGLTEFLPVSSSGHLIVVPALLEWHDPFLGSLAFSVMLHLGTLAALFVYFRADWLRLVPAGLAALRDRSFRDEPDRRLAWLLAAATVPALVIGFVLNDAVETSFRRVELVAAALVVGGAVLWLADRAGGHDRGIRDLGFGGALGIGFAQALALVPGISRAGMSISAGRLLGLDRPAAARFSFLMATPIIAAAGAYETLKLLRADAPVAIAPGPLAVGVAASLISGLLAIAVLLRFVRTNSMTVFAVYRVGLAAVVIVSWLGLRL